MGKNYTYVSVEEKDDTVTTIIKQAPVPPLPDQHVRIKVHYSSINYKDALACQANGGVIRQYPMTPGIDLAGEIIESNSSAWPVGKQVIATSYGLGVSHPGGFATEQIVPNDWLVALPENLTTKQAMAFGTAGFTAALAVQALHQKHLAKEAAIVVTGASGGVGSIACALLHALGYQNIIALSRKENVEWLKQLGVQVIEQPSQWMPEKIKPLAKQKIAGMIDTVGGQLLSALIPQLQYDGIACLCGNAGGIQLNTTVLPFILRNVQLIGIDSVQTPMAKRQEIWQWLAKQQAILEKLQIQTVTMVEIPQIVEALLAGLNQGRSIIQMENKE